MSPRPLRASTTYKHPAKVTKQSARIEEACMTGITQTFTPEEIRYIRDALERVPDTPMGVWLWSMFDSISTPEEASK